MPFLTAFGCFPFGACFGVSCCPVLRDFYKYLCLHKHKVLCGLFPRLPRNLDKWYVERYTVRRECRGRCPHRPANLTESRGTLNGTGERDKNVTFPHSTGSRILTPPARVDVGIDPYNETGTVYRSSDWFRILPVAAPHQSALRAASFPPGEAKRGTLNGTRFDANVGDDAHIVPQALRNRPVR